MLLDVELQVLSSGAVTIDLPTKVLKSPFYKTTTYTFGRKLIKALREVRKLQLAPGTYLASMVIQESDSGKIWFKLKSLVSFMLSNRVTSEDNEEFFPTIRPVVYKPLLPELNNLTKELYERELTRRKQENNTYKDNIKRNEEKLMSMKETFDINEHKIKLLEQAILDLN